MSSSEDEAPKSLARAIPSFKSFASARPTIPNAPLTVNESSKQPNKKPVNTKEHKLRDRERHEDRKDRGKSDHHRSSKHDELKSSSRHRDSDDRHSSRIRLSRSRSHSKIRQRFRSPEKRSKQHSKSPERKTKRTRSPSPPPAKLQSDIIAWDTPDLPYKIDWKGDSNNLRYGTIHKYDIPKYWRKYNRVLGLSTRLRINHANSDHRGIVVDDLPRRTGKRDDAVRGGYVYAAEKTKLLRVKRVGDQIKDGELEENRDFVRVSSTSQRKRRNDDHIDLQPTDYRSIYGPQVNTDNDLSDSDLELDASSDEDESAFDDITRETTIRLARITAAEPHNIEAWLELVDHQETLLLGSEEGRQRRKVKQGEKQSLEEVKLDVLEKALAQNQGNARLLTNYMNTGARLWDSTKLQVKWNEVLRKNSGSLELWKLHLNFMMTDFSTFKFQDCVKAFEGCMQTLRNVLFFSTLSAERKVEVEKVVLYVFLRATLFVREAGFSELATAAWQCLAELNTSFPKAFVTTPHNLTSHDGSLKLLGEFWESEVYRIGEVGAKGFDAFTTESNGDFPDPKDLEDEGSSKGGLDVDDRDFWGSWLKREVELSGKLPARTTDEVEEDDPFRVILFRDISKLMYCFQTPEAKDLISSAFLAFSGVILAGPYSLDSFIRNNLASSEDQSDGWFWPSAKQKSTKTIAWFDGRAMEPERGNGLASSPFGFCSAYIPTTADTLFPAANSWFSAMEITRQSPHEQELTSKFLKDLVSRQHDEKLALMYLAFENRRSPTTVKKVAKQLLKLFSTSIPLYNAYAMIEWRQGNIVAARNVFSVALGMASLLPDKAKADSILLWRTWTWEELCSGNKQEAINILLCVPSGLYTKAVGDEHSMTALLKTRKYLEERQYYLLANGHINTAISYSEARALLEYMLSKAADLSEAFAVLEQMEDELERRNLMGSSSHEDFLMIKGRFCYTHATSSKLVKVTTLREVFKQAIQRFPNNTAFLSLYAWNEGRTRIENRVRTMLQNDVLVAESETTLAWGFAIWTEVQMGIGRRLNDTAVRSFFERAVECERTSASIDIWKLYIEFEIQQVESGRAKKVLLRAIRACPWAKDIRLMAFSRLRTIMNFGELRKVYTVLVEKELRVHVEIEDLLDDWDEKYGGTVTIKRA